MLASLSQATIQSRDVLIIRGKMIGSYDMPSLAAAFPELKIPKFEMISTANYKGYSATWAVFGGQLFLVGLEANVEGSKQMLWDEKVLTGQKFPLKVEAWSGVVKQENPVSIYDPNTNKREKYNEVTTIVIKKGKVTNVEFDKKVPIKDEDDSK